MTELWIKTGLEFVDPDELIEISREVLVSAVKALGGPAFSVRATNEQLLAAFDRLANQLPDNLAEINEALAGSCSVGRRAKLMARRIEIEQAAKAAPISPHRYFS